ncbi:MAG TPA: hypothetical protein DCS07_13705 [Bdellovibrionales bacterium]|nr:hypothetical protein [Bdellovibrionales bacterium]
MKNYRRELDLRRSVLTEIYEFTDEAGRDTQVKTLRCASLSDQHLLIHEVQVICRNHIGPVHIDTSLEDPDLRLLHPHLKFLQNGQDDSLSDLHVFETRGSQLRICLAARAEFDGHEQGEPPHYSCQPRPGEQVRVRRFVSVYTSRDVDDPVNIAKESVRKLDFDRFSEYISEHASSWEKFWNISDVVIEGNDAVTETLRFNSYHLRIAAPRDGRASMGARTLSGRAYEGHIFWDVEIFILPIFLYTHPALARNLISYRYHTLEGARQRARLLGCEGACYAWESTAGGLDATPKVIMLKGTDAKVPVFTGTQQIHVTGGVAFAVNHYWNVTGDDEWVKNHGAEILFETSRFWASRAKHRKSIYHIEKVVGPDEYHHGVSDNTYTNWLARYNLQGAVRVANWLQATDHPKWEELVSRLGLKNEEIALWEDMARHIHIPVPNSEGVYPQFEGFFDLKDVSLNADEKYRAPFERLLKWSDVNACKILKQADFLMVPFLFPNAMSIEQVRANFFYYERITDHGSSLSPSIHSAIASRIGEHEFVQKYWQAGLNLDLMNLMKNTALGFHAACAGGTWQALIFHILGLQPGPEQNSQIDPIALPVNGRAVHLNLVRRGQVIACTVPVQRGRQAA